MDTDPDEFLSKLGADLEKRTDLDSDLLKVLRNHLLKEAPETDAVSSSKAAILEIAKKRCSADGEAGR